MSWGRGLARRALSALEVPSLVAVPLALLLCAAHGVEQSALLTLGVAVVAIAVQACGIEVSRPGIRQVVPCVVLGAAAAAGRVMFAPIPNVKPVCAIAIIAGASFGRQCGFAVGALAAFASNAFFGQGPWTPWQMYSWGLVGFLAGVIAPTGLFERPVPRAALGLAAGLVYGIVMDTWNLVGFVHPITLPAALANYALGLPHNLTHGVATAVFLSLIYRPWHAMLRRVAERL